MVESGAGAGAAPNGLRRGLGLRVDVLSPTRGWNLEYYFSGQGRGWSDLFDKPWAEVVREGSPYFPDGKLEVVVEVQVVVEK